MSYAIADLPNLVIALNGTTSGAIGGFDDAESITVFAPSALTGTVTIQIEPTATGTSWRDLGSAGADVTIAAGNSVTVSSISFRQMRLSSSIAETAARTFNVVKNFRVSRA